MTGAGGRRRPGILPGLKMLPCLAALAGGGLGAAEADPALAGILQGITAERLLAEVDHLVSFGTRRWDQPGGKEAQEWIRARLAALPLDEVFILGSLFLGGPSPPCPDAADANDDGRVDLADAVAVLVRLFVGAGAVPEPAGACGPDLTADALGCPAFPPCGG